MVSEQKKCYTSNEYALATSIPGDLASFEWQESSNKYFDDSGAGSENKHIQLVNTITKLSQSICRFIVL